MITLLGNAKDIREYYYDDCCKKLLNKEMLPIIFKLAKLRILQIELGTPKEALKTDEHTMAFLNTCRTISLKFSTKSKDVYDLIHGIDVDQNTDQAKDEYQAEVAKLVKEIDAFCDEAPVFCMR